MTTIYRVIQLNHGFVEEYFRSLEGACYFARTMYKEYLFSKDVLYTEDIYPKDITIEGTQTLLEEAAAMYEKYSTVTLVCEGDYTLSITEVALND